MNKFLKTIIQIIGVYLISSLITLLVFNAMGLYVFNMLPTKVVVLRMLIYSVILSIILELLLLVIGKRKRIK